MIDYIEFENNVIGKYLSNEKPYNDIFMNHGYVDLDTNGYPISVANENYGEKYNQWKYQVKLYQKLLDIARIIPENSNGTILDIGCGNGGGISFYKDHYKFDQYIGVDLNPSNIENCKKHTTGIDFYEGSATKLPINNQSIDVITSVESCIYYEPFEKYVSEIRRVLNIDGILIQACLYYKDEAAYIRDCFLKKGFVIVEQVDIVQNVQIACAISKFRFLKNSYVKASMFNNGDQHYMNNIMYEILILKKQ
jgi:ubiquinone/menaquinone biosynthesis C-methylase UbiE